MTYIPRKIGFYFVDESRKWPIDMPTTDHVWEDEEHPFGDSHGGHRYDVRCAICMFHTRSEAREAVLERFVARIAELERGVIAAFEQLMAESMTEGLDPRCDEALSELMEVLPLGVAYVSRKGAGK